MRSRNLFQFIQLENVELVREKAVSTSEALELIMLETDQLQCQGSSSIKKIGYCDSRAILEIHFHSSGRYQYSNVPRFVFDGMLVADSVGKYYHRCIKVFFTSQKL
jgi:hypothetical protein